MESRYLQTLSLLSVEKTSLFVTEVLNRSTRNKVVELFSNDQKAMNDSVTYDQILADRAIEYVIFDQTIYEGWKGT